MWIQSFFLFSIVWAFGSVLKANVRKEFERQIRAKILCNTEEISAIASLKSKIVKKNEGKSTFAGSNTGDKSNKNK